MGKRSRQKGGHPASRVRASSTRVKWERLARDNGWDAAETEERREQAERLLSSVAELTQAASLVAFFFSRRLEGGSAMLEGADGEGRRVALEELETRLDEFRGELERADEVAGLSSEEES